MNYKHYVALHAEEALMPVLTCSRDKGVPRFLFSLQLMSIK